MICHGVPSPKVQQEYVKYLKNKNGEISCMNNRYKKIYKHREEKYNDYKLPETYHNISFLDTITRSLFFANQLNGLSTPLLANVFFLLEKYCEVVSAEVICQKS